MIYQFAFSPLYVEWLLAYSFFWWKITFALHFLDNFSRYILYLNLLGHSGIKCSWEGKNVLNILYLSLDLGQAVQHTLPSHNHLISTKFGSILRFFFGIIKETLLCFLHNFSGAVIILEYLQDIHCDVLQIHSCVSIFWMQEWLWIDYFPDRIIWPESYPSNEVRKSVFSLHCV